MFRTYHTTHTHTRTDVYSQKNAHTLLCPNNNTHNAPLHNTHTNLHTYTHTLTHIHTCTHTLIHSHPHPKTHTYTHTHTHTHTQQGTSERRRRATEPSVRSESPDNQEVSGTRVYTVSTVCDVNPFLPDCKTTFSRVLYIFLCYFYILRPEHDCYAKFTSCSTQRNIKTTL